MGSTQKGSGVVVPGHVVIVGVGVNHGALNPTCVARVGCNTINQLRPDASM
jgi:hypothetical protein